MHELWDTLNWMNELELANSKLLCPFCDCFLGNFYIRPEFCKKRVFLLKISCSVSFLAM